MSLKEALSGLRPPRLLSPPPKDKPLCLVLLSRDLAKLTGWLLANPGYAIDSIVILDAQDGLEVKFRLPPSLGKPRFLAGASHLANPGNCALVFLFMTEWPLRLASMAVPGLADRQIHIVAAEDKSLGRRKPLPGYARDNLASLEKVYEALYSEVDREIFARRVKSILTGDPGHMRVSPFLEYEHPAVSLRKGDIVLDGGLSHMVGSQKAIARKVGPDGICHGFEPIPWMAAEAAKELAGFPQYHVHALGLAAKPGAACFASLADSSHLTQESQEGAIECRLTSIDHFVHENRLPRVDAIKLDVEGAELAALRGGEKTIAANYPDLIVCLYHKPADLFEIPLFILDKFPGYQLRLGHSSCCFTDTILYARSEKKLKATAN